MSIEGKKIWIAGHTGMVGSALTKRLKSENLVLTHRSDVDLRDRKKTRDFFKSERPDIVFLTAAKVGGIHANSIFPVDFLLENLQIQNNVIESAFDFDVSKLIFYGSACTYPKESAQPIKESALFNGQPEETNIWYATAKLSGIKLMQAYSKQYGSKFITLMPTNTYGPGDNFNEKENHVIPALMKRFFLAKENGDKKVEIWGSGKVLREFLYVDDLADASVFLGNNYDDPNIINVGTQEEISIMDLASLISEIVGFSGKIETTPFKPDGVKRKVLDSKRLFDLGWHPKTNLRDGLEKTYEWAVRYARFENDC